MIIEQIGILIAIGLGLYASFFKKSNTDKMGKDVESLKEKTPTVIEGDGITSESILMHKGKVIYTKLK